MRATARRDSRAAGQRQLRRRDHAERPARFDDRLEFDATLEDDEPPIGSGAASLW